MELTAIAQLRLALDPARQPRVINVSVEYLRSGRAQTTYARADLRKVGRRIANMHVEAWQGERSSPVAALRGHFLLGDAAT
jgi:acyl-coenzyme A thioesterase PaaI-like protein